MARLLASLVLALLVSPLLSAAPKRRAVEHPTPRSKAALIARATRVADRVTWTFHPRLHWENAVFFDGLLLFGEQLELRSPGSGVRFVERSATVLLQSDDPVETVYWGDGTAFGQAAMDLYRLLPPGDPRRAQILTTLDGPLQFAQHAVRVTPASGAARDPWWVAGGYGTRFWQDDLYMLVPWLVMYGSLQEGLPGRTLPRNLAYEWIEAYVYDHRPESADAREAAVPSARSRRARLLWDEEHDLFQHAPDKIGTTEDFWARGNGWSLVALARAAALFDAPYSGGRYEQVIGPAELRDMLRRSAESLIARRTADGGWGAYLSNPDACATAETSGTALLTFFLARGVNDGWLERDVYVPIVLRAMDVLMRRVQADGTVTGIQPPDVGPGCGQISSTNGTTNVNYGPGAVLLAVSEVLKFPESDLASGETPSIRNPLPLTRQTVSHPSAGGR